MKVNCGYVFLDRKGKVVKLEAGSDAPATMGDLAFLALNFLGGDEQNLGREQRLLRGRLAQRIVAAGSNELDLKAEEVTLIKNCFGKMFDPWVVAQCEDVLDPQEVDKK